MRLLAVALGIGAALAGGTSIASADTSSNAADDPPAQSSTRSPTGEDAAADANGASGPSGTQATESRGEDAQIEESDNTGARADRHTRAYTDPSLAPSISLEEGKDATADAAEVDPEEASAAEEPSKSARTTSAPSTQGLLELEEWQPQRSEIPGTSTTSITPIDSAVPSPADQVTTEYGDIGKWMLQSNGEIADYGGAPDEGRKVLESVNVIIVEQTSKTALGAAWRLNAAMRRSGFPPRLIHSTGFLGLIDDRRYRQQPRGLLAGYSDGFFLLPNNHGRIFGPDPIETSSGYVWSGAFSTEELAIVDGLPRHVYVSSNMARDALVTQLVTNGQATLGGMVSLENSYDTATTTTGDHDGNAVVVALNDRNWFGAATNAAKVVDLEVTGNRTCVDARSPVTPSHPPTAAPPHHAIHLDPASTSHRTPCGHSRSRLSSTGRP